ncbi:uncharacterized protein LOC123534202 [Mercenaria mercenaria]|uniref:uncharacterized protein LOC123534202 n=1 Tax=Mercenaria mercenaria TaxID=6596 RepID=UPI00234ED856|nr:uncharacterized protein LOC123534202 [Mercenaria mercenaria]
MIRCQNIWLSIFVLGMRELEVKYFLNICYIQKGKRKRTTGVNYQACYVVTMNISDIEQYLTWLKGNHNGTFDLDYYYDLADTYEIETFRIWEERLKTVKILNKVFLVVSILIAVIDFLLLISIFSASVRERSASWYLYHLNFVTILQITFSLPRLEAILHDTFGTCMFFSFIEWTLTPLHYVNLVLMDIEILATVLASDPRWRTSPQKRFFVSMTAAWISCILFSVVVMFFGHEEHPHFPICFHQNKAAEILGHVVRTLLPFIFSVALIIAGLVLFVRAKRSPENYSHMTVDRISLQTFNEWFACFMMWNISIAFVEILVYNMQTFFFDLGLVLDISIQMFAFIIH